MSRLLNVELDNESGGPGVLLDIDPSAATLNVLVVENHRDTRQGVEVFLRALGYQASGAESVADALALADRMRFDVLLSDISLPDGDGWQLLQQLNARGRRPPHAIAMSGLGSQMDHARSEAAGFATHMVKPFAPETLEEALRLVVSLRTGGEAPEGAAREIAVADASDVGAGARLRQQMHDGLCQQLAAAALLQGALVRRLEMIAQNPPRNAPGSGAVKSKTLCDRLAEAVLEAQHINRVLHDALSETQALMRGIRDGKVPPGAP